MIARVNFATSSLSTLKPVLWYQGESDINSIENVEEFQQRLEDLITNICAYLQNSEFPCGSQLFMCVLRLVPFTIISTRASVANKV